MHVPDGMITGYPLAVYAIIAVIILVIVFYKSKEQLNEKNIPLIALFTVAAVIVQMIELPLPVAACVHVSLITLISLYDLRTSIITYMFVTIIQAFLIGEGGVSTLGVNLLNLAILAPIIAYSIFKVISKINRDAALFISGFGTITLLGLIVSIEYAIAGTFPITYGLTIIVPVEALVGVLEGVVTVVVMRALSKIKPELVPVMQDENV